MRSLGGIAVALAVLVTAACNSPETKRAQGPTPTQATPATPPSRLDVVLATKEWREGSTAHELAYHYATLACAKKLGFAVNPGRLTIRPDTYEPDLDDRRRNGWHLADPPVPSPITPPPERDQALVDRQLGGRPDETIPFDQGVVSGTVNVGGCNGDAIEQVYGSVDQYDLLTNGPLRIHNAAVPFDSTEARTAANAAWVTCMSARGYQYAQQADAQRDFRGRYAAEGANREAIRVEERRVATDDGECINAAGFPALKMAGAEAYLAQASPDELAEIDRIIDAHRDAQLRSEELLPKLRKDLGIR